MRSRGPCLIPFLSLLMLPGFARAAERYSATQTPVETQSPSLLTDPEIRNWIYGGLNLGFATLTASQNVRESDKSGYQVNLKVLYSRYFEHWVADLGLGYFYNHVGGDDRFSPLLNPRVNVGTRAGFIELSPRYRFDTHWQAGAVANVLFGTDVSFDESTTLGSDAFNVLVGPRVNYELPMGSGRWRFGAQAMTDVTILNRQLWVVQADIQYGIPFGAAPGAEPAPEPSPRAEPAVARPAPAARAAPRFAEITPERGVKIYLGEAVLRFKTASFDLRPSSRRLLTKVAGYLKRADKSWKTMRVEGHTDIRGKLAYNERLAVRRANAVKDELIAHGLPGEKLTVSGFGPRRPIDDARDLEAYALNRRVELWLDGVTNPEVIIRELNDLK